MERVFAEQVIENQIGILSAEDAAHMSKVMRKQIGDRLEVVFGGELFLGEIVRMDKKRMELSLLEQLVVDSEPKVQITLFHGIAKGSRMDYAVQKAAEIGVVRIVPVEMERSVKKGGALERWNRISYEACKQCKRVVVPEVAEVIRTQEICPEAFDLFLMPYELEREADLKTVLQQHRDAKTVGILIGPEGGIADDEATMLQQKGARSVTLGKRILRTETAGLVCAAAILYEMGEMA